MTTKKGKKASKAPDGLTGTSSDKLTSLEDNSVSANEMSAKRGGKKSKLTASTDTVETIKEESAEEKEAADNSTAGRLARSGYVLNEDQVDGRRWVGIPWQRDEEEKKKGHTVRVTPISEVRPWTGLQVRPENGEPFAVPEVPKDETPAFWLGLLIPGTKDNFIKA